MKKILSVSVILLLLVVTITFSCKREVKECSGVVKDMNDTCLVLRMAEGDFSFNIKRAEYDNGAVMINDSVKINYIGDPEKKGDAHAVLIYLIPPKCDIVEDKVDTTKELVTAPLSKEDKEKFDVFVKDNKK